MRLKKFMAVAMSSMMVLSLTACGSNEKPSTGSSTGNVKDDPKVTLVMAEVNPLDTIVGQTDAEFKKKVEELTGGSVTIDLQANGVLGSENDVLDTMLGGGGTIDISRISAFALTSYGASKSSLLSVPYTFTDRAHYWNFVKSDLSGDFLMEPHDIGLGVRGLFYGEEGFRHFFTKSEVKSMADLKGKKLRVSNDPVMTGMVKALGANPTVVAFNELYSSLNTGVVDGAEQPIANYRSNAFPEVANNLILDGHTLGAIEVIITDEAWDKLTENQQKAIMEAASYAEDFNAELSETEEKKILDELKASGCKVTEVTNKKEWQDACKDVIASAIKGNEELYQKILDLSK